MLSKRRLITLGIVVFVLGLITLFPARVAVGLIAHPDVVIGSVDGTIWRGSAKEASVAGIYLRDLTWKSHPLQLLGGKLSFSLEAKPASGFVETQLQLGFDGTIHLSDLTAAVPLSVLAQTNDAQALQGNASVNFERIEIVGDLAVAADGVVQIADLVVPAVSRDSLGAYRADFHSQNNGIVASIEDTDGVLDLAGSLQIRTDRSYQFLAQVILTNKTPASVRQQLQRLPPPNARGQYELREEGVF